MVEHKIENERGRGKKPPALFLRFSFFLKSGIVGESVQAEGWGTAEQTPATASG